MNTEKKDLRSKAEIEKSKAQGEALVRKYGMSEKEILIVPSFEQCPKCYHYNCICSIKNLES